MWRVQVRQFLEGVSDKMTGLADKELQHLKQLKVRCLCRGRGWTRPLRAGRQQTPISFSGRSLAS